LYNPSGIAAIRQAASTPIMAAATLVQRPTNTCVLSPLAGHQYITKSLTTRVEMEFITDKLEEISDATRAASTTPRTPLGSSSFSSTPSPEFRQDHKIDPFGRLRINNVANRLERSGIDAEA
jgi:hypothetical protein